MRWIRSYHKGQRRYVAASRALGVRADQRRKFPELQKGKQYPHTRGAAQSAHQGCYALVYPVEVPTS